MKEKEDFEQFKMDRFGRSQREPQNAGPQPVPQPPAVSAPKFIAEHTVAGGETLSHISLKYYASATKTYWMIIYEANKALIGDNPNRLKRGLTLRIPDLPVDLKK